MTDHDTLLRTPALLSGGEAPVLLRCMEHEFVETLLEQLADSSQWPDLRKKVLPSPEERAARTMTRLYLPVHHCFNMVVMEAYCDTPGYPRLDPAKIESAGMVVRRHLDRGTPQRFVAQGSRTLGWRDMPKEELDLDPNPLRRPRPHTGLPELDAMMAELHQKPRPTELTTTLYVAPPDVCAATGRTLLFGVVPVTDSHPPDTLAPPPSPPRPADITAARVLLPTWLKRSSPVPAIPTEIAGHTLRVKEEGRKHLVQVLHGSGRHTHWDTLKVPAPGKGSEEKLEDFIRMLWMLWVEVDAFSGSAESKAILHILNQQQLQLHHGTIAMGTFLEKAARVLLRAELGVDLEVPQHWTPFPANQIEPLATAVFNALRKRAAAGTGAKGRYGMKNGEYSLRVFMRVRCDDGCPPKLVWSKSSPHFSVARWYDSPPEGAHVPRIELPDLDRNFLEKLKPNIAFKVPTPIFNLLRNNAPGDFLDGKGSDDDSGFDIVWICSFSIPIITICAFIMLMIFITLLNLLFWWLPFVKVCIPLPGSLAREIGED